MPNEAFFSQRLLSIFYTILFYKFVCLSNPFSGRLFIQSAALTPEVIFFFYVKFVLFFFFLIRVCESYA